MGQNDSEQVGKWSMAEITLQSPGPRYRIQFDSGAIEGVDNVEFNGFCLGLDGRAEVEYKRVKIDDSGFESTAKFYADND